MRRSKTNAFFICAMQFTLNGKRWRLLREPTRRAADGHRIYGICSSPEDKPRFVKVDSRISGECELNTLLHELLHCAAFDVFDEDFVDETATGIARLLWRLGYRKTEQD